MSDYGEDEKSVVVIDAGSGMCRGGFAGDFVPKSIFPSVIGIPKVASEDGISKIMMPDSIVGKNAQEQRELLMLHYPIKRGIITDWDGAEKLFEFTFQDLRVDPVEKAVLMSETPLNPMAQREKMMQLMFESFGVLGLLINTSSILGHMGYQRSISMVVDIGHGVTSVSPCDGIFSPHDAIQRQDFAGHDLTHLLSHLLYQKGFCFSSSSELECVREIKEKVCFTPMGTEINSTGISDPVSSQSDSFTLPDGNIVKLTNERFMCGEALFNPAPYTNHSLKGLHELVHDCFTSLESDLRNSFYYNIVLTGGTSCMVGLKDRLQLELEKLLPSNRRLRIWSAPERKNITWIGGSILGSISLFSHGVITKKDYEEYGPSIAHRVFK